MTLAPQVRPAPTELTTARLRLRQPTSRDAEAVFAYASSAEATRYMGWPRHQTLDDSRAFLAFADEEWRGRGCGTYLICDASGAVLGSTGLHLDEPHRAGTGYILHPRAWGQGLATEAARAMIALGSSLGLARVEAHCVAEHTASARVLEKSGMQLEGLLRAYLIAPNFSEAPVDTRIYATILR
jgi:[ribosomal protein S5]-alanine N-acetyltransferase